MASAREGTEIPLRKISKDQQKLILKTVHKLDDYQIRRFYKEKKISYSFSFIFDKDKMKASRKRGKVIDMKKYVSKIEYALYNAQEEDMFGEKYENDSFSMTSLVRGIYQTINETFFGGELPSMFGVTLTNETSHWENSTVFPGKKRLLIAGVKHLKRNLGNTRFVLDITKDIIRLIQEYIGESPDDIPLPIYYEFDCGKCNKKTILINPKKDICPSCGRNDHYFIYRKMPLSNKTLFSSDDFTQSG